MIINDLDGYYIVFDTKNWNTELDTLGICRFTWISFGVISAEADSSVLWWVALDGYAQKQFHRSFQLFLEFMGCYGPSAETYRLWFFYHVDVG